MTLQPSDRLVFHARSAASDAGKGIYEELARDREAPADLGRSHWRRVLSDEWSYGAPFLYRGVAVPSVKAAAAAAANEDYRGLMWPAQKPSSQEEKVLFERLFQEHLQRARWAKFSAYGEYQSLLLSTGKAQLWELCEGGRRLRRAYELEDVRERLAEGLSPPLEWLDVN